MIQPQPTPQSVKARWPELRGVADAALRTAIADAQAEALDRTAETGEPASSWTGPFEAKIDDLVAEAWL